MYRLAPIITSLVLVGARHAVPALRRFLIFLTIIFGLAALALVAGCNSSGATTTTPTSNPLTTTSSTGSGRTFREAAAAGETVFSRSCARCHGNGGQGGVGPALIGSGTNIGHFSTAQALFDYISVVMPQDAPGSLPREDYLNVLGFILTQNKFVADNDTFDPSRFSDISLIK